ncbi:MAG: FAD-binding and (Fe-S)-binding domain-containing protein [Bacteroidales bacterium]|nr:FAD-binding and (Fe-S)-binding domain-containing protein [Bacteroidales bacterium]
MTAPSPRHDEFLKDIRAFIPADRIYTDELRRLAWGTDASFYRKIPRIVVRAADENEISRLLKAATANFVPVTFRAAGTSLSGQSITDSVLIVAGKGWEYYEISGDASAITLEPGIVGARVNEILAPFGRIFAPDPASKRSAMVGGIIINNASGMNCGTHANSDKILRTMRIVLADGTVLDTADAESRAAFAKTHPRMLTEICDIRDLIRADRELTRRIRHKYSIKNVTGLNLLPFVTYDDPFDIIAHCMVGSEGTLGFLSRATLETSHLYPYTASAMLYFDDMAEACRCVVALKKGAPVYSCEMLDRKSLEAVHDTTGTGLTALLLDTKADTAAELNDKIDAIMAVINQFRLYKPAHFSTDPAETGHWWGLRSGIFPAVGGTRPSGTTALIEDIAFYIEDLPTATVELVKLLNDSGYPDACIYGHALEGNYHFVISQSFDTKADIDRYRNMMQAIEHLVVDRYDGSLKAEHGVGRNMAPFVRREWGDKAWNIMRRIKDAFDPDGILNQGVIFNDDPECFIKDLKPLAPTYPVVDKCIECGFCEVNCVSCGFTLSARQRVVVTREISRLRSTGNADDAAMADKLSAQFKHPGIDSCAGDGLCSTSCPMGINTGDLIHILRREAIPEGSLGYKSGLFAARHLTGISKGLRIALGAADLAHRILGDKAVDTIGRGMHAVGLPLWTESLPAPYSPDKTVKTPQQPSERKVVYFPSCINRAMGVTREKGKEIAPLVDTMVNLCHKAGYEVIFPDGLDALCCGMIWESKGMPDIADNMTAKLEQALIKASDNGRYPVLCDQSPCLHRMRDHIKSMQLYEPAEFIERFLVPHLRFTPTDTPVAVHITCSTRRMGLGDTIVALAGRCSTSVTVPAEVGCCGFAGDKGFNLPELNRWALRKLRPALDKAGVKAGYSNSRTCEIGLTHNSGISYKSIVYLVDECTSPA